ncbi:AAA family ATPase, partial [Plesiomonas shigelloides]|uniref:AAA family ATPase n=1 Tax=Plesiomonas shigelloides TaxID=703 RepID=UPI001262804F
NLGKILKANKNYYNGLKTITKAQFKEQIRNINEKESEAKVREQERYGIQNRRPQKENNHYLIKRERPFLLLKDSGYITQYQMSSGEYLLLKILDFIYYRITYATQQDSKPFLIMIDEVEIALHPSSQKRLIQFCNEVSQKHNICIIFSTHSREIITNLKPEQILLIETHLDSGKPTITTPCYPYYAIRGVYEAAGYDYIVCVEDDLAKKIVMETIKKLNLSKNKRVNVTALGGWREVLNFANEFKVNGLFHHTKIVIVLDGDVKSCFHKEFGSPCRSCDYLSFLEENEDVVKLHCNNKMPRLNKRNVRDPYPNYQDVTFLPISSLEKEVRTRIIIDSDYDLIVSLDSLDYFGGKSVSELIAEYERKSQEYFLSENFKKKGLDATLINFDADGKILWRIL